jgi:hypothetical protein
MVRSFTPLSLVSLLGAVAAGCAADPMPPPTSAADPSNPDAPEAPLPPPLTILKPDTPNAAGSAAPAEAPPAHHHHNPSIGEQRP